MWLESLVDCIKGCTDFAPKVLHQDTLRLEQMCELRTLLLHV
uniref:Uncharacterized protein n=1 Tax=Anguilla anguilla TaxID=7936 RepID=A0A0E9R007_ANGAN